MLRKVTASFSTIIKLRFLKYEDLVAYTCWYAEDLNSNLEYLGTVGKRTSFPSLKYVKMKPAALLMLQLIKDAN